MLDPAELRELGGRAGHDIVTSSGDTLLGADDKAGVAEIVTAVAHLAADPELPRPTLRVGFTPDEEIGEGASLFDIEGFGAACAYTLDGSSIGELQDETFTAAAVTIRIEGVDVHPGFATGQLVHAGRLAARILTALPSDRLTPETTSGREGFIHPFETTATPARATMEFIVRDFDDDLLDEHVALLRHTAEEVMATEPRATMEFDARRQYPNMRTLPRRVPGGRDQGRPGDPRRGHRAGPQPDPRRHRRLHAEREGPADAEHLRRRPRVPLAYASGRPCRTWRPRRRSSCISHGSGPRARDTRDEASRSDAGQGPAVSDCPPRADGAGGNLVRIATRILPARWPARLSSRARAGG